MIKTAFGSSFLRKITKDFVAVLCAVLLVPGDAIPTTLSHRQATQSDPSFFEAHYNAGLASTEAGDLPGALAAYENALAARPESLDARYNFARVLKQAGYVLDAANELEKLLTMYPNDGRANLALGNIYAQQLQQPAKARQHYLKVLESDPHNPRAGDIRFWLAANPP